MINMVSAYLTVLFILYTGYISRWFNFRESLIAKIFTLIHVYLH